MKKVQISAKNVQKAIDQGLKDLGVGLEDVDVKILDEGGLFRKAKVELLFDDGVAEETAPIKEKVVLKEKKQDKKEEKKISNQQKKTQEKEIKENKIKIKSVNENQSLSEFCTEFLENLCAKMNIEVKVSHTKNDKGITFNLSGEKVGPLIGKRGETLHAIQELLSNVAKKAGFKNERIYFDVENYKEKRENSLIGLAERMARKAQKIDKPIRLERMNAYERKIIHTALQSFENIATKSEGEEPNRYLVIIPKKQNEDSPQTLEADIEKFDEVEKETDTAENETETTEKEIDTVDNESEIADEETQTTEEKENE